MAHNAHDAAVARATIRLADTLGLQVVAEGVENEAQLKWLQAESCTLIQGYLLSEPLEVAACEQLLLRHKRSNFAGPGPSSLN